NFAKSKSLLDLPNEILLKIFKYLDLRSALRLRLNKRLDELQSNLHYRLNCDIDLNFLKDDLAILTIAKCGVTERTYNDISILEAGFKRLSHKVGVNRIWITAAQDPNEQQNRILAQLLTFKAEELTLYTFGNLPLITLPPLLALADNISEIDLDAVCNALTAEDLCTIHEVCVNYLLYRNHRNI
ncbi:hypothetical protein PMAYCL1PPCAC_22110, partial [Pristionchus mayeri]